MRKKKIPAAGGGGAPAAFISPPVINSVPVEGVAVGFTRGTVTGTAPVTHDTQQWTIDGVDVGGGTGETITFGSGEVGKLARVRDLASNAFGSASSTSDPMVVQAAGGSGIIAAISASRTSGPMPLGVTFSFLGTVCTVTDVADIWSQLWYEVNYGDNALATYSTTGASKNAESGGPLGAHVFNSTAGVKTVTVTVHLGKPWLTAHNWGLNDFVRQGGNTYKCAIAHLSGVFATDLAASRWTLVSNVSDSATIDITAQDPDVVYAGNLTVCIDPSGATTGGPSGCLYTTAWPSTQVDNKRYMFKHGNSYGSWTVNRLRKGLMVTGYGAGATPIFTGSYCRLSEDSVPSGADKTFPEDCVVHGLDFRGGFRQYNTGKRNLIHNCIVNAVLAAADIGIRSAQSRTYYADPVRLSSGWASEDYYYPENNIISECYMRGSYIADATKGYACTIFGDQGTGAAVIGNDMEGSEEGSSLLRIGHGYRCFVSNNKWGGPAGDSSTHWFKLHASGLAADQTYHWGDLPRTEMVVIQNNKFGGGTGDNTDWALACRPTSESYTEQLDKIIIYNNLFDPAGINGLEILMVGSNMLTYGNSRTDAGAMRISGLTSGYPAGVTYGPYRGQET